MGFPQQSLHLFCLHTLVNFVSQSLLTLVDSGLSGHLGEGFTSLCFRNKMLWPSLLFLLPPVSSQEIEEGGHVKGFGILSGVLQGDRECRRSQQSWWQEKKGKKKGTAMKLILVYGCPSSPPPK